MKDIFAVQEIGYHVPHTDVFSDFLQVSTSHQYLAYMQFKLAWH